MSLEELTSITSKDRILLYLSDFRGMDDRYELPAEITQRLIAVGTGVQRKHLSQYLSDLIQDSLIVERKAHIHGMKQRMNGYYLCSNGYSRADVLRKRVEDVVVPIKMDGHSKDLRVADIDDATSVHLTLSDIIREAVLEKKLEMSSLETIETRKREAIEVKELDSDIYKRALMTAWHDGRVTATERFLVEELRKHLKIPEEQHRKLEVEIVRKLALDRMEFRRIYRMVLEVALSDKMISGPEEAILEGLRRVMRISRREHEELVREVEFAICGPPSGCENEKDLLKEALKLAREENEF
ncbi:MAG: hypothetical protein A3K60_08495 [Euryarchaeota archaeon RBG_19FT_COMBO_56_21]|nr:MAG: hypothetical protein A3K60_08495 [Euryarchaeota archaeon RBG_19FT_COMBO_56_21]